MSITATEVEGRRKEEGGIEKGGGGGRGVTTVTTLSFKWTFLLYFVLRPFPLRWLLGAQLWEMCVCWNECLCVLKR